MPRRLALKPRSWDGRCQFAAGLHLKLKATVAGNEGDLEQLLAQARFEEAKLGDLATPRSEDYSGKWPRMDLVFQL